MKLIDRIRPIADLTEYSEFAELWNGFLEAGRTGAAGPVARMIQLGNGLHRRAYAAASDHAKAQVRGPFTLTEPQAAQLILETKRCAERCVRKALPELCAYAEFIEATLRDRRPQITPLEA